MSFIETEASVRYETVNGKKVMIITPKSEVTLTNMKTGQEYMSDAESDADVDNPETDTTADDIETNIQVKVTKLPDVFGKTEDD